jgi:hypothetical protein
MIPTDQPKHEPKPEAENNNETRNNDTGNQFNIVYGVISVLIFFVSAAFISNQCACSHSQCQFITGGMTLRSERGQSPCRDM